MESRQKQDEELECCRSKLDKTKQ